MAKRLFGYGRGVLLLGLVLLMAAASSGALQALLQPAESVRQTASAAALRTEGAATARIGRQTDAALDVAQADDNDDEDNDEEDNDSDEDNSDDEDNDSDEDNDGEDNSDNDAEDNELPSIEDIVIENIAPGTAPSVAAPAAAPVATPSPSPVPAPATTLVPIVPLNEDAVIENIS